MNKDELISRRALLATQYKEGLMERDEFLSELDAINKEYTNPFYEFTNLLDLHVKLRMGTQGRPTSEILVLDTIIAECLKRSAALKEAIDG